MRIYSMRATFGKLEHETLTLEPGLNIIEAPNEWGKSTWCAFMAAMFYGLETKARTTKTALADKERYAPWSGAPMSGRMELCWQGRDITIERRQKGRIPMGDFRAYETGSGLAVPELTADNCGEMLLGVEQNVFRRAGFIRFSDLPVTQDETLRRRLNALVTTADESGQGEALAGKLRELKNNCRFNRSGLLPQAEEEQRQLQGRLRELEAIAQQQEQAQQRLQQLHAQERQLRNHAAALDWEDAREDARRLSQARERRDQVREEYEAVKERCDRLPSGQEAQSALTKLEELDRQRGQLPLLEARLGPEPAAPEIPQCFLDGQQLEMDIQSFESYAGSWKKRWLHGLIPMGILVLAGVAALFLLPEWVGCLMIGMGIAAYAVLGWGLSRRLRTRMELLEKKYGSRDVALWRQRWERGRQELERYARDRERWTQLSEKLEQTRQALDRQQRQLCGEKTAEQTAAYWTGVQEAWQRLSSLRRELEEKQRHFQELSAVIRTAPAPEEEDSLTLTREQTRLALERVDREQEQHQRLLGQHQGRKEALGSREATLSRLEQVRQRIERLEDHYSAITLAQKLLEESAQELQRRFAPRIARRAGELMASFTDGRYDRLTLGEDFSLQAGARGEDTLHAALWRSDGTVDQLYLSLRLAVAEELMGTAPLVLDDALVRFDEKRLKAALDTLKEEAGRKQVILFTCQGREKAFMHEA